MTITAAPPAEEVRRARDHRWPRFIARRSGRLVASLWVLLTHPSS